MCDLGKAGRSATRIFATLAIFALVQILPVLRVVGQDLTPNRLGAVERKSISVVDVLRLASIGDPNSLHSNDRNSQTYLASPDGKLIALVLRVGNPATNSNDAELLVYDAAEILDHPKPRVLARFSSTSNFQPISFVRWRSDSKTLVFVGTQGNRSSEVYRVDAEGGRVVQLTKSSQPLLWFDITPTADFVFTARKPAQSSSTDNRECKRSGCLVTQGSFYTAMFGDSGPPYSQYAVKTVTRSDLNSGTSVSLPAVNLADPGLTECLYQFNGALSSNGRFALALCKLLPGQSPEWWSDYQVDAQFQAALRSGQDSAARQLVLLDYDNQTIQRIVRSPYLLRNLPGASPLWIDSGQSLILAGALEALDRTVGNERYSRATHYAILLINPATRGIMRIGQLDPSVSQITDATWEAKTQILTISTVDQTKRPLPKLAFQRHGFLWEQLTITQSLLTDYLKEPKAKSQLVIRQSLNDPPKLFARSADGTKEKLVLDPNPWIAQRRLGKVEAISWTSKDDRVWHGGLYYPLDYVPGRRYPIVLQTHGFAPDQFSLSGITRNFVAQPLAAHNIFVLQIAENTDGADGRARWPALQAGYEAAINHLDSLGLIDRQRVGMLGWSWTDSAVGYMLTHSSYPITASAFIDGADWGWWWYMMGGARNGEEKYEQAPFGQGMDVWRQISPSFNLDHLHTAMMMWTTWGLTLWDWYAALRRLDKPVEYWYLPDGLHEAFKIGERMRTNELLVDWFCFWLKGEQDPDPTKVDQYSRWYSLRELYQSDTERSRAKE